MVELLKIIINGFKPIYQYQYNDVVICVPRISDFKVGLHGTPNYKMKYRDIRCLRGLPVKELKMDNVKYYRDQLRLNGYDLENESG